MNEGFCWNHFSCRFFILAYFIGLEISHHCEVGEFCVMLGTCRCVSFLVVCVTTGVLVQNLVLGFLILSRILRPSPLWGAATLPWPICLCSIGMLPTGEPLILIQVLNEIMICFISEALFWPYPCFLGGVFLLFQVRSCGYCWPPLFIFFTFKFLNCATCVCAC